MVVLAGSVQGIGGGESLTGGESYWKVVPTLVNGYFVVNMLRSKRQFGFDVTLKGAIWLSAAGKESIPYQQRSAKAPFVSVNCLATQLHFRKCGDGGTGGEVYCGRVIRKRWLSIASIPLTYQPYVPYITTPMISAFDSANGRVGGKEPAYSNSNCSSGGGSAGSIVKREATAGLNPRTLEPRPPADVAVARGRAGCALSRREGASTTC